VSPLASCVTRCSGYLLVPYTLQGLMFQSFQKFQPLQTFWVATMEYSGDDMGSGM
jgi:hypothetical protein